MKFNRSTVPEPHAASVHAHIILIFSYIYSEGILHMYVHNLYYKFMKIL